MADEPNGGLLLRKAHFVIYVGCILVAIVISWATLRMEVQTAAAETAKRNVIGSDLARINEKKILIVDYRLANIEQNQQEMSAKQEVMRVESQKSFEKILQKLDK